MLKKILTIFIILIITGIVFYSCSGSKFKHTGKKVVILGIDGMDPNLTREYIDKAMMPNVAKLAAMGTMTRLETSEPPQSPVAWSNFITGMDPGGHGIYDFIHRDAETRIPYLSTSSTEDAKKVLKLGKYKIPLEAGKAMNLRQGEAFWTILEKQGIESIIYRIPSNFPPVETNCRTFAGMGTPDILGTYGIFTFFTTDSSMYNPDVAGGKIVMVKPENGMFNGEIEGPPNSLQEGNPQTSVSFTAYIDPSDDNLRLEIGESDFVLRPGEWSDWAEVEFPLLGSLAKANGIVRFYLKEARPDVKLYASPVNLAPGNPALPLSTPPDFSKELYKNIGNFYTQGMPEDTKALSAGVFDFKDYLSQARNVLDDRMREFDYIWNQYQDGVFFFYFGSLDQCSHALYSTFDKESPIYDQEMADMYGHELMYLYSELDKVVGRVMDSLGPDDLLIIMSDHGFAPFRYCFDLNTWLLENGYITLKDTTKRNEEFFPGVDWKKTKAYGLGINSLYLNVKGREQNGSVSPVEKEALENELISKLTAIVDPVTRENVIKTVHKRDEIYHGPNVDKAPDLIVGYNWGYRASWETILGKFPQQVISPNPDKWSGDHCVDHTLVPGTIVCNRKIEKENPALYDLAPTILTEFGLPVPEDMTGKTIFNK